MKRLNARRLKKIHDLLTNYDQENKNLIYNTDYILEYCFETDIQNSIKTVFGRFDDQHFYNIFNSLDLKVNIKEVNIKRNNKLIKYNLNYSDIKTFNNNYNEKFK